MPKLPSGRTVGLSIAPALAKVDNFFFRAVFKMQVESFEDFDLVVSIVYFRQKEDVPYPGDEYLSGITLSALGTERCDWSAEDIEAFREWLAGDANQKWLHTAYNELLEAIKNSKPQVPESLDGILDDEDDCPVFNTGEKEDELPESVIALIGELIKRDTVQSVSFPFNNSKVWRLLIDEQVRRAKQTGLPLQKAFTLSGPDGGLSCDPSEWGGAVHIPYEGVCEGDLFIAPLWRNFIRENNSATLSTSYHYLLLQRDLGELNCATRRIIGDGWVLYESTRPYVKVDVFGSRTD